MAIRDPQHEQTQWSGNTTAVVVGLVIASLAMIGALAGVTHEIGPAAIPIWLAAAGGTAVVLRGPVGQAIGRVIGGRTQDGPAEVPPELYAELDELRARVGELEERVDFSERLLTAAKERERTGGEQ